MRIHGDPDSKPCFHWIRFHYAAVPPMQLRTHNDSFLSAYLSDFIGRIRKLGPILCKTLKILHLSFYEEMALLLVVLGASLGARNGLVGTGNQRIFKVFGYYRGNGTKLKLR